MTKFQPLLAPSRSVHEYPDVLQFPVAASPKFDGVRAFVPPEWAGSQGFTVAPPTGVLLTRKLKPVPNQYTRELFSRDEFHGFDGELVVGDPWVQDVYRRTYSGVSTHKKGDTRPEVTFYVFDRLDHADLPWSERFNSIPKEVELEGRVAVRRMPHKVVHSWEELYALEEKLLRKGYEGVMVRDLAGRYKFGRATEMEHIIFKLKRFEDAEAEIVGVYELEHNDNVAVTDERGYTKRSSHKANKRGGGTLGGFICKTSTGLLFRVGMGRGLTTQMRDELWAARDELPGQFLTYSSLPVGVKDLPRHPKFVKIRGMEDMPDQEE